MAVRHIRTTDANVKDARFRSRSLYANKLRPVFCGAESGDGDVSRAGARHMLKHRAVVPAWSADFCPKCVAALMADAELA